MKKYNSRILELRMYYVKCLFQAYWRLTKKNNRKKFIYTQKWYEEVRNKIKMKMDGKIYKMNVVVPLALKTCFIFYVYK